MDFKVAGTPRGITALQMDIKCEGLTQEILEEALAQAQEGRIAILRKMLAVLRQPRAEISPHAPRLLTLKIPEDKIGAVIGPGGRTVRALQEEFAVKISIEDDGRVTVAGPDVAKVEAAFKRVKDMTAEVEVGSVYQGKVTSVKEFGAFVEILPGQEGMVHVSELADGFVRSVTDVVRIGDDIEVKVIGIDDFGKIKLSRRALLVGDDRGDRDRPREDRGERDRPWHGERGDRPGRPERVGRDDDRSRTQRGEREDRPARDRGEGQFEDAGGRPARDHREEGGDPEDAPQHGREAAAMGQEGDAERGPREDRAPRGGRGRGGDDYRPHRGRRGRGDREGGFRRRPEGRREGGGRFR
jgi:polyribonucleotide nucleotidyltransferase